MAPEFIESHYEDAAYPLERCTIMMPAPVRSGFRTIWRMFTRTGSKTLQLTQKGMTFATLLKERCPVLDPTRFGDVDLASICLRQIQRIEILQAHGHGTSE